VSSRQIRKSAAHVAVVVTALFVCAASTAADVTVTDDRGRTVSFERPPARIVSLLPSLTETVCELGACARLVGTDRYSNWPASVQTLPKVGGLEDASIEPIVALHPDVVLAAQSSRAITRLEELGIRVVSLQSRTFSETERVFTVVARVLGVPESAGPAWQRLQASVAAAASRVPTRFRNQTVYFEISEAPYAASASSFIGELLGKLGLGNAVPGSLGPFPKLNPEFVVRAQPDLIFASERAIAEMPSRPGWDALVALQQGRTCGFAHERFEILIRPGPRLGEAANLIAACLESIAAGRPP
jgi:cobalamin transport system substrate-binding protein